MWNIHEVVGGSQDGKRKHLPCREDGEAIWMDVSKNSKHTILNSSDGSKTAYIGPNTMFARYVHKTREDGKHIWELG